MTTHIHELTQQAYRVWDEFAQWDSRETAHPFAAALDREIARLEQRKRDYRTSALRLASPFVEPQLFRQGRELYWSIRDIDMLLDYLLLREVGDLSSGHLPFIRQWEQIFDIFVRRKTRNGKPTPLSRFRIVRATAQLLSQWLPLPMPVAKLGYGFLTYFIEHEQSVPWVKSHIVGMLEAFEYEVGDDMAQCFDDMLVFLKREYKRLLPLLPGSNYEGFGKMLKVAFGFLLYSLDHIAAAPEARRPALLFKALQTGIYWGAAYPLIDDVVDKNVLSDEDVQTFNALIFEAFATQQVPAHSLPAFAGLLFEYIGKLSKLCEPRSNEVMQLLASAYRSQHLDVSQPGDGLYRQVILKASLVRILTAFMAQQQITPGLAAQSFRIAMPNQLEDDMKDFFEDAAFGKHTPFTLFASGLSAINPLSRLIRWTEFVACTSETPERMMEVLAVQFCEIIKQVKEKHGDRGVQQLLATFAGTPEMQGYRQQLLQIAALSDYVYYTNVEIYVIDYLTESVRRYLNRKEGEKLSRRL